VSAVLRFPGALAAQRDGRVLADNAGGTQVPRETIDAVARYLELDNAQQGAPFARKIRVTEMIDEAKDTFADLIGVPHGTIGFGLNTTTNAFALARTMAHTIRPGDHIVVTDTDHYANVAPWTWLARFGAVIVRVPVDANGDLDEAAFAAALALEPVLVTLPWASNATGNVFDVGRFAAAAKDAGAIVIVDGVQAAPHLRIDVPRGVDVALFSVYKIYGTHVGALYADPEFAARFFTHDDPFIPSDPINWSVETGTLNLEGLAGWLGTVTYLRSLGDAEIRTAMDRIAAYERDLSRDVLRAFRLRESRIRLYGRPTERDRVPVFSFNVRDERGGFIDPDTVAVALDAAKIEASAGNYYSPRVLLALAPETNGSAVRLSFAHYNDPADVDLCFAALDSLIGATV
jgi:selenocysteine lyase/cysteine desulfurase